jgi:hypothetical protein
VGQDDHGSPAALLRSGSWCEIGPVEVASPH